MNVALRRPMTLAEFLAWEDRQELRYEFDGFQPVAMVGGTEAHSTIQSNLVRRLGNALDSKPCRVHGSHLKVEVAGRIRYPDAFVVCTPAQHGRKLITDPVVVFEILSDGSAHTDLFEKNENYGATPSVQRYVVLDQDSASASMFVRKGEDWVSKTVRAGQAIAMPEIGITLAMDDIYEGVTFPPPEAAP